MNNSGFNAMGKPVPLHRYVNGLAFALKIIKDPYFNHKKFIEDVVEALESDQPDSAFNIAGGKLDTTGTYMLMAYLLTGEPEDNHLCDQCKGNMLKYQCSNIGCKNSYEEIMV